jgi:hypothetical protein
MTELIGGRQTQEQAPINIPPNLVICTTAKDF